MIRYSMKKITVTIKANCNLHCLNINRKKSRSSRKLNMKFRAKHIEDDKFYTSRICACFNEMMKHLLKMMDFIR